MPSLTHSSTWSQTGYGVDSAAVAEHHHEPRQMKTTTEPAAPTVGETLELARPQPPMPTTTTTEPAAGYLISPEMAEWSPEDWQDHFDGDHYALSVLHAADQEACLLSPDDLCRLLGHHGANLWELRGDQQAAEQAGHRCLPIRHAGQALTWLGY